MKSTLLFLQGRIALFFLLAASVTAQQGLTLPEASQRAVVKQQIGLTEIKIDYHRPGVKERQIWGALVPYDQVWRAGANENTTIYFSNTVKIDGREIPAGKYGLHMVPTDTEWTIILSKDNRAWGSFFYNENKDQIRFKVKPETCEHQEWLIYCFDEVTENSASVSLRWEKLRVPFIVEIDLHKHVIEDIRIQLTSLSAFFWRGWNQAANYCYTNGVELEQGLQWADRSIQINKNVTNTFTKALILDELGKNNEALLLKEEAFLNAPENEVNNLGYQFLFAGKVDPAIEIFIKNTEMYPDSWNVWDSLAEAYLNKGETELAVQYYTKALNMAPEEQHARINGVLKKLVAE
jgi:tetratricopeptide (TPR) repeat protein